jgi:hypothetical protein
MLNDRSRAPIGRLTPGPFAEIWTIPADTGRKDRRIFKTLVGPAAALNAN